ncbi:PREDICTED: endothelin-converting enzyme-like 1 [Branchiostoma belcheri]|uniref:Endothelin-converting enzyme-like 1 n=1 Tax=Branchiostoma belcheri TaxID=7741 RepID=A0A6P4ZAL0_BRABE|nr:PREDICTED: endothelin-converting enzyme-like 1 [Branchiostoma belcheri]
MASSVNNVKHGDPHAEGSRQAKEAELNHPEPVRCVMPRAPRPREAAVMVCLFLSLTVCVIFGVMLATRGGVQEVGGVPDGHVCLTADCITSAALLLSNMDATVDPCQDFFQFSCGGWLQENPIPPEQKQWGVDSKMWETNERILRRLLATPTLRNSTESYERKAKDFFQSCMQKEAREQASGRPLLELMDQLGGWAALGNWSEATWNFNDTFTRLHLDLKVDALFFLWVNFDDKDSSKYVFRIDQGGLGLPDRSYYISQESLKVVDAYRKLIARVVELLGADPASAQDSAQDVVNFETKLAELTVPESERTNVNALYNNVRIHELKTIAPMIDWGSFFHAMVPDLTPSARVVLYATDYLGQISQLIADTPARTLNSYLLWRVAASFVTDLSQPFRKALENFNKVAEGTAGVTEEWRLCLQAVDEHMGMALGAMFVKDSFSKESKEKVREIAVDIRRAFVFNLAKIDWMDDKTKASAVEKSNHMVEKIGYPDYILNDTLLDEKFTELRVGRESFFQNRVSGMRHQVRQMLDKLERPVDRTLWTMPPHLVNAYYWPNTNEMVFPAGILQRSFYDSKFPMSMNFGGIGGVIAHELTHGYDDWGGNYDKEGNLKSWWSNSSWTNFTRASQCVIDLYNSYVIEGKQIDGRLTLGENIADIGGLKQAYYGYKLWRKVHQDEPLLPGLNRSHEEVFFMSFAQSWCITQRPEALDVMLLVDPHAPPKYRVIGSVSQLAEFSEAFHCPVGSPMNPVHKCSVW